MKQIKIKNGFIIARYNPKEERSYGYPYGAFTKKEWAKPSFMRSAEYNFFTSDEAINWVSDCEWVVMK